MAGAMAGIDWTAVQESTKEAQLAPELPATGDHYPDWIMLAGRAYISDRHNSTVAHGDTSDGNPIQVSLFAADPPAVSHLRVHCPDRENKLSHNPAVVFSRDDLILFDVCMDSVGIGDYFVYRTGLKPSRVPGPDPYPSGLGNTGIVPCDGNDFAIAALYWDKDVFNLAIYFSSTGAWTTRVAPVEQSELVAKNRLNVLGFQPTKVIPKFVVVDLF